MDRKGENYNLRNEGAIDEYMASKRDMYDVVSADSFGAMLQNRFESRKTDDIE